MQPNPPLVRALGENVRALRKNRAITQEELAFRADLHRTYVADVERGGRNLSLISMARIAAALNVSVSELCTGIDKKSQQSISAYVPQDKMRVRHQPRPGGSA